MKRFFLFILILSAFVSCGNESESESEIGKTILSVDNLEYDSTVCSFIKEDNKIVLALNSIQTGNEEKYLSIVLQLKNNKLEEIAFD